MVFVVFLGKTLFSGASLNPEGAQMMSRNSQTNVLISGWLGGEWG